MLIALYFVYKAKPPDELVYFPKMAQEFSNDSNPCDYADCVITYTKFADIYGQWESALSLIEPAIPMMKTDCDEPRLARLYAQAALCAARTGDFNTSYNFFDLGEPIARRLGEENIMGDLYFAQGVAVLAEKFSNNAYSALRNFSKASDIFVKNHRLPNLIPLYLEWMKASYEEKRNDEVMKALKQAQELLPIFRVYKAHLELTVGQIYIRDGNLEKAKGHLVGAVGLAEQAKNEWVYKRAKTILKEN
jgi:tetratricopeptide (TPR) repeat protein